MKCKFCKKEINKNTKTCPFCDRKTSKRKMTGLYWGILGLIVISVWLFTLGGSAVVADWFYSDGFTVESNFERNLIPLNEMTIEIDLDFDATFVNRMNYYHGLLIGIFDGEIYSQLTHGQVKLISSDNLEAYELIYPPTGGMSFSQIHITDGVLYYTPPHGDFGRYDFKQTNQDITIVYGIDNSVNSFAMFDNFALHRIHTWNFARHHALPRVDGNIYRIDLASGNSEVWLEGIAREFFADEQNDRILFTAINHIYEINFAGENRNLITEDFWHYSRLDPSMERGWMYDGNRILWINSGDWTGIESSLFSFSFDTREQEYLGRINNASSVNVINDYILVNTTDGDLYLIDIDAMHRRLLSNEVGHFAVVGDRIFYRQIGTRNIYVMDLNGNVAFFGAEEAEWDIIPEGNDEY